MGNRAGRAGWLGAVVLTIGLAWTGLPATAAGACLNEALRTGQSRNLPDCRAYELVTPEDMNGLNPTAINIGNSTQEVTSGGFDTFLASPSGESVIFDTSSGSLPGFDGNGVFDQYRAKRGVDGWITSFVAPNGAQSFGPHPGGVSPDHLFSFWETSGYPYDRGSLQVDESNGDRYLREPGGSYEPIGVGSLGTDFEALGKWITPGGSHIIFSSRVQLESGAPESGIEAVYDRAVGGPTHVVSLLPGDVTPSEDAIYQGGSADGSTQVFKIGVGLYARRDNTSTVPVAEEGNFPAVGFPLVCHGFPVEEEVTLEFQWLRDGAPIAGATAPEYTPTALDAGKVLQCQVFATSTSSGSSQTSQAIVIAPPPATSPPETPFFGLPSPTPEEPTAGTTVTCLPAAEEWVGEPTFTYQWFRDGAPIAGATAETYEVQAGDIPSNLQCAVTGTNAAGAATKLSPNLPTSPAPDPFPPFAEAEVPVNLSVFYAGTSSDGSRVFYEQQGRIFAFDTASATATPVASGGEARIVFASPDGSRVYFASTAQLVAGEGTPGAQNLYAWHEGEVHFVATLDPSDFVSFGGLESVSLAKWRSAVGPLQNIENGPGSVPVRSTPDGRVLVFQSHASLTSYESEGRSEIYRYDDASGELTCVSCSPRGDPPVSEPSLQSIVRGTPTTALSHIANVTEDGAAVFFQTGDPLVAGDVNGSQDVYEWKDGTVSLISSGQGGAPNYIYGATPSGSDVFFVTNDVLSRRDRNGNGQKIYDARVGGGFAEPSSPSACEADACQGQLTPPPALPPAGSSLVNGPANPKPRQAKKHRKRHRGHGAKHRHKQHHHKHKRSRGGNR
jgi:hypothetical protein